MTTAIDRLPDGIDPDLADSLQRIAGVAIELAHRIARGGLDEALGAADGSANADGDVQKALDVIADEAMCAALTPSAVRFYASEEQHEVVELNPQGNLALAIDPLDGSSNIDANVSIGTIFGLYPAEATGEASVLRPARELLVSGYAIYGPQCGLVLRLSDGATQAYVLDPDTRRFRHVGPMAAIPAESTEYAINASNYRHWPAPIRTYIDDRIEGAEGPLDRDFNMRWVASLVAETHRILSRGGVFLYPGDDRKGYEQGRLRLIYECGPIGHLVEGAGGLATDGIRPIADRVPAHLHDRTPFVFGSANKVGRVADYFEKPDADESALFGARGLFRT